MEIILVTGGAGFIGSNFIPFFLQKNPAYVVVNLDALTYAGNLDNLSELKGHPRYEFVHGDICDNALVRGLFSQYNFRGVIHFAAESHVDNSISDPEIFVQTNVMGTFNLLEVAKQAWMIGPNEWVHGCETCRFHHVSTDEVYGSLCDTGAFVETTPYAPNSPYSASKAAADFMVRAYHHTYGMNVVTTNCSNNFGPKQHREKLIPTIIRKAIAEEAIPIYGNGQNVRDWLYVLDHCEALDLIFHRGRMGDTYNVGGNNERSNLEIVDYVCAILDRLSSRKLGKSYKELVCFVTDRPGHDKRYAIDASKLEQELGWRAGADFEKKLEKTVSSFLLDGGVSSC